MLREVEIIDDGTQESLTKEKVDHFCAALKEVLCKDDYDFCDVHEVVIFVLFSKGRKNEISVEVEGALSKQDNVNVSLLYSRLSTCIQKASIEGKCLGVDADFYIALNKAETIRKALQKQKMPLEQKQLQAQEKPLLPLMPKEPRFKIGQIELNKKTKKALQESITLIKKQSLIYEEWGFKEVDGVAKTIINFYGKPGTGKTMSAHIIASELGKKIINSNYSDIESKYVGDAPKNLVSAFDLAEKEDAVLFFDEADSFLGKRIANVTQSADQAMNSLRSELLKLLEERAVIVIFATNLQESYDKAFHSRILRSIDFELPNKKLRKRILLKHIPKKLYERGMEQFSKSQLKELVELTRDYSGREIKNAVLRALNIAAMEHTKESDTPTFDTFKEAFLAHRKEFDKTHGEERKNTALGKKIKNNLKKGNFKTIKRSK